MDASSSKNDLPDRVPRRGLRFDLRTFFIAVTIAAAIAGWWSWTHRRIAHIPLAFDGYCPVVLNEQRRLQLGDERFTAEFEGLRFHMESAEAKEKFATDPRSYAPVAAGCDVVLAKREDRLVPGKLEHSTWFERRIYLFADEASLELFRWNPRIYHEYLLAFPDRFVDRKRESPTELFAGSITGYLEKGSPELRNEADQAAENFIVK